MRMQNVSCDNCLQDERKKCLNDCDNLSFSWVLTATTMTWHLKEITHEVTSQVIVFKLNHWVHFNDHAFPKNSAFSRSSIKIKLKKIELNYNILVSIEITLKGETLFPNDQSTILSIFVKVFHINGAKFAIKINIYFISKKKCTFIVNIEKLSNKRAV